MGTGRQTEMQEEAPLSTGSPGIPRDFLGLKGNV